MKKVYRMENLDCAHCAAKIERAVAKIDGVEAASVNFMAQKMTLELAAGREAELCERVKETVGKIEPECLLRG